MSESQQEVLARILEGLKSEDSTDRLAAIHELGRINYSSAAILAELERLALKGPKAVRQAALEALDSKVSQYIRSQTLKHLNPNERLVILAELEDWEEQGLIQHEQAEVLARRYDFSRKPIEPEKSVAPESIRPTNAPAPRAASKPEPAKIQPKAPTLAESAAPRLTLTERLLSQTSINIFLYLGAFLVIGAAAILAALVASTRLPILLGVTLLFAAGAVAIRKRLPQPSFTLFIVFSFLLPIDANVISQSLHLEGRAESGYWAAVFFTMAVIWGAATWFYTSRLFSVAAFASLTLAFLNFGEIFDAAVNWNLFSVVLSNLIGLLGVRVLKTWKDNKFALPLFFAAQITQLIILFISFASVTVNLFFDSPTPADWLTSGLTWFASASFYAWSGALIPFALFPWAAAASLLPVSWLMLKFFNASNSVQIIGLWIWGTLFASASEFLFRRKSEYLQHFSAPALLGSLSLFLVSGVWGLFEDVSYGFACLMGTAVVYTILMVRRPRAYIWFGALLAGLAGYFTFFNLPLMERTHIEAAYQFLGAALLLTVPELAFRSPFSSKQPWRWPPLTIGIITAFTNILAIFAQSQDPKTSAIVFGSYAILSALYALHFKSPNIGYLATAFTAISIEYALQYFHFSSWVAVFTGLAVLYFVSGYFLRKEKTQGWGSMLRISGLALGAIISLLSLIALEPGSGWYALGVGGLFIFETYLRRADRMESSGLIFFSIASILILRDFKIYTLTYHLLSASLLWLGADLIFSRTLNPRRVAGLTRAVGGGIAILNGLLLLVPNFSSASQGAFCYGAYAAFFALYAIIYRQPNLGYATTTSIALSSLYSLEYSSHLDQWLPVFTGLAFLYFAAGLLLRLKKEGLWGMMLRTSGLILGILLSITALLTFKATAGWYVLVIGAMAVVEVFVRPDDRLEAGGPFLFSIATVLILHDFDVTAFVYTLLSISLIWLGADLIYARVLPRRRLALFTRLVGGAAAVLNGLILLAFAKPEQSAICFGAYTIFFAVYAWFYRKPLLGYAATASFPLSAFFELRYLHQHNWLYTIVAIAGLYYAFGYFLRRRANAENWSRMLLFSALGLGVINSLSAPLQAGLEAAIPVSIAATLFAIEAFARRNVWLGFPVNLLYLESYYLILVWLKVDQPQYFSMGAAILGMLMHYLLTRAGSKTGAFLTGMFSQLTLLGTTYIQLYATEKLGYFVVIFFQALAVLIYGIIARSRSLVIAPIVFIVLSVFTVIYGALKGISTVILIGCTGIVLLLLGILTVVLRERIIKIGARLNDWSA